jgi:hypothetical protein
MPIIMVLFKERTMNQPTKITFFCLSILLGVLSPATKLYAQSLSENRAKGINEVRRFANKEYTITATLSAQLNPKDFSELLGMKLKGCPSAPLNPPQQSYSLTFSTGGLSAWAGDLDGVNIRTTSSLGETGGSLGIPTINTIDAELSRVTPRLEFQFGSIQDVERTLIDRFFRAVDACLETFRPGEEIPTDVLQRCGIPLVERSEAGQTCINITNGTLLPRPDNQNTFDAIVNVATMCDFVGFGSSGDTNTGFTTCYTDEYRGEASISQQNPVSNRAAVALRKSVATAFRKCTRRGRLLSVRQKFTCTKRNMMR